MAASRPPLQRGNAVTHRDHRTGPSLAVLDRFEPIRNANVEVEDPLRCVMRVLLDVARERPSSSSTVRIDGLRNGDGPRGRSGMPWVAAISW